MFCVVVVVSIIYYTIKYMTHAQHYNSFWCIIIIFYLYIIVWGQVIKEYGKKKTIKIFCKKSMTKKKKWRKLMATYPVFHLCWGYVASFYMVSSPSSSSFLLLVVVLILSTIETSFYLSFCYFTFYDLFLWIDWFFL